MARVLLIDDSPTERALITGWLAKHGYIALEAEDAETGLALAHQQKPDLVLMDIIMPGTNGFEATRKLRRSPTTQAIPVVLISSKSQPSDLAWGKKQGAAAYLTKPFTEADLLHTLKQFVSQE